MTRILAILFFLVSKGSSSQTYRMFSSKNHCLSGLNICDTIHKNSILYSELMVDTANKRCELLFFYEIPKYYHMNYLNTYYKGRIEIDNNKEHSIILDSILYNEWRNFGWIGKTENQVYIRSGKLILKMKYLDKHKKRIIVENNNSTFKYRVISNRESS